MHKVGDKVISYGKLVTILEKHQGDKVKHLVKLPEDSFYKIKRKPCTYTLSNGKRVRGDKIKRYNETE